VLRGATASGSRGPRLYSHGKLCQKKGSMRGQKKKGDGSDIQRGKFGNPAKLKGKKKGQRRNEPEAP